MRLYFHGHRHELGAVPRDGTYEEFEIDGRRGVLLSSERPLPVLEACIPVEIPDDEAVLYARGPLWPDDYLVPLAIVQRHNPGPDGNAFT
jgi:hypothetical protein